MEAGVQAVPRRTALIFAALTLWLLAIAIVRPLSVDESQYVAATALVGRGLLPYRDFAYLQTPLQPFVFAPLQWLFPGHLLLAVRAVNAVIGAATVMLACGAARRIGANERSALIGAAMLVTCESFAWSVGVARNDMLPAILMTLGLFAIAKRGTRPRMFGAGVALGLAAAAKISYAVPAAAIFLSQAWNRDREIRLRALWLAAGIAAGLLPCLILITRAPSAFLAEAIVFPVSGPTQFYTEIGSGWRLGPARFGQLLIAAAVGPALIAAVEVTWRAWRDRWLTDPARRALIAAAIGGLLSATLNKPFQIFYLLPALPPLFVLASLLFSRLGRSSWLNAAWALFVAVGILPVGGWVIQASSAGLAPSLDAERRSQALGAALRAESVTGGVATLAGQYVENLDPRFAAGPFLYRTRGFLSAEQARQWHIVTRDQEGSLADRAPAAIVTGIYPDAQAAQESDLAGRARAIGYQRAKSVAGFTIWTRR